MIYHMINQLIINFKYTHYRNLTRSCMLRT